MKAEMEAVLQQMVDVKKNGRAYTIKKVKCLCKKLGLSAGILKDSLAEGRKRKSDN